MKNITRLIGIGYIIIVLATAGISAVLGPVGYAPMPIQLGPTPEPVIVTIWYSTEKKAWFEEAVRRFNENNPRQGRRPIQIVLRGLGSREISQRIASQDWRSDGRPIAISPGATIWIEALKSEWRARGNQGEILAGSAPPLALTPIVLVAWEQRARFLWPDGQTVGWQNLHAALADERGWPAVVQRAGFAEGSSEVQASQSWGTVKLGHTSPLESNSGAQLLLLMAYAYHNKTSGLTIADVQNPDFIAWMRDIERAVPKFGDSTGAFMDDLVRFGPSQYDVVATYENLAIQNLDAARRWGNLRVYYPPATTFSDHPYALLSGSWVTAEERAAAEQFQTFLLSRPLQELALQYGFRPADPNIAINSTDPANPFVKYTADGIRTDVGGQVAIPSGDVLNALLAVWQQQVNR
jgi:hypothetical protein